MGNRENFERFLGSSCNVADMPEEVVKNGHFTSEKLKILQWNTLFDHDLFISQISFSIVPNSIESRETCRH